MNSDIIYQVSHIVIATILVICLKKYNTNILALLLIAMLGYLSFEDVRDFVVKMELKKSAFNAAQTKKERVKVLLAAREDWKELMGRVKQ